MKNISSTLFFDGLVENHSQYLTNTNGFVVVPYDQNRALAAEQIRENLDDAQRYYAEVKNNPMNYGAIKDRQQTHLLKSTDYQKYVIPRQEPKIYDHGPGNDVPLEFLVSHASKINHRKKMMNRTPLLQAPVTNVRIYTEDLKTGNYDTNFYGNTIPALARYVARHCYSATGKRFDISTIYKLIDSKDYYVGRSEKNIIDRLSLLTKQIDESSAFPNPKVIPTKLHRELIDRLNKSNVNGYNRVAARQWGIKFARDLLEQGMGAENVPDVIASVDWFGKVCDQFKVPLDHVLQGYVMRLVSRSDPRVEEDASGMEDPRQRAIYVYDDCLEPKYIAHELVHSLEDYKTISPTIYDALPHTETRKRLESRFRPMLEQHRKQNWYLWEDDNSVGFPSVKGSDDLQEKRSGDSYAATNYITQDRTGNLRYASEYLTQFIQRLLGGEPLTQKWADDWNSAANATDDTILLKDQRGTIRKLKDRLKNSLNRIRKPKL